MDIQLPVDVEICGLIDQIVASKLRAPLRVVAPTVRKVVRGAVTPPVGAGIPIGVIMIAKITPAASMLFSPGGPTKSGFAPNCAANHGLR